MDSGRRILISFVLGMVLAVAACPGAAYPRGEEGDGPRELFEAARSLADKGKNKRASKIYERIADDFPGSPIAAESRFKQGECLELAKDYYRAFKAYQGLLEQFPGFSSTSEVIDRQFGLGVALMNKKGFFGRNLSRAREIFRQVVRNAPFGDSAPRAQFNLAMTFEKRKHHSEAVMEYGKVISSYPGSDVVDDADYRIAICHHSKAETAPHDQAAASKAVSSLKGFLKRYPDSPKAKDAKVKLENVSGRKAKALFEIAEYYEKMGSPKSAIYYYQEVIEEYPGLEMARRAELKIRRDHDLSRVDVRIEELLYELDDISDEIAYSRGQIKRLRQPGVKWHVWERLRAPEGAKGERLAREKKRLASLRKEFREKKAEIKKIRGERWEVNRITSAQLKVDEARRKHQVARMDHEAARDDRPGPSAEGDEAAVKAYERSLGRKRAKLNRAETAVSRAEKRINVVKESVTGRSEQKDARLARQSRLSKKKLRRDEFRNKMAALSADLSSELKTARRLTVEEKKQAGILRSYRRRGMADEAAEAEANLSLIASKAGESRERIAGLERDIERRRKIRELENRCDVVLRKERRAEADLHRVEAAAYEGRKRFLSFLRGDPVSRAVEKLDRLRRERRLVENELSELTSGKEYITDKERRIRSKQAELERRTRDKAEAKEKRKKGKEEARERKAAEKARRIM